MPPTRPATISPNRSESSLKAATDPSATGRYADYEKLVAETHRASLKLREQVLRKTVATEAMWPRGALGDTIWALAALQLNEKTAEANARLLRRARDDLALMKGNEAASTVNPEQDPNTPWSGLGKAEYTRILYLFHAKSTYFPGRLTPETEAAMKEALWSWVSRVSRVADAGLKDLFFLLGTENHNLTRRPDHYLVTALLKEDAAYQGRTLADGHTLAEHAASYTAFLREWPRARVRSVLWA